MGYMAGRHKGVILGIWDDGAEAAGLEMAVLWIGIRLDA